MMPEPVSASSDLECGNPFSTRHITPGRIRYLTGETGKANHDCSEIAARFLKNATPMQIVGPHGSGKSTLVNSLLPSLRSHVGFVKFVTVRESKGMAHCVNSNCVNLNANDKRALIALDGIERLSLPNRIALLANARRKGLHLLITCHRKLAGVPVLFRTTTSLETFERIVDRLQTNSAHKISRLEIESAFREHGSNIREALMQLYDAWETKRER